MYIKGLAPYFRNLPIRNITEQNCDRWVKERGAALASETFVHELDVMKTVFEFALDRGLILSNPAKHIKRRKVVSKQIVVPSLDQFKQLVSAIRLSDGKKDNQEKSKDGADLVEFLAYSGARIGEVVGGGDANEKRPCSGPTFTLSAARFSCPAQRPRPLRAPSRCQKDCASFWRD
jgi:integrase